MLPTITIPRLDGMEESQRREIIKSISEIKRAIELLWAMNKEDTNDGV